jgi:peptide/nickel transport system ATP-binding protein
MDSDGRPRLACEHLDVVYRRRVGLLGSEELTAVRDVSLAIQGGGSLGVVGESGCGKSSLARAIVGVTPPRAGTVSIDEQDLWNLAPRPRLRLVGTRVGMVFQDPRSSLNPRMTAGAVVADPLEVHGVGDGESRRRRVGELLEWVGLPASASAKPVRRLSGGQLQRVAIARALALKPDFVVADEPTSALDVSVQAGILNLLRDLQQRQGFGLLVISHDIDVIRFLADDILVMYLGRVMEYGPADAVHDHPLHPYTRALFSAVPSLRRARRRIVLSGALPSAARPPSGCPFRTRCWKAEERCAQPDLPIAGDDRHHAVCVHPELTGSEPIAADAHR